LWRRWVLGFVVCPTGLLNPGRTDMFWVGWHCVISRSCWDEITVQLTILQFGQFRDYNRHSG
jgi:hypothetical protein